MERALLCLAVLLLLAVPEASARTAVLRFIQPLTGAVFNTDCNGQVLINIRVSIAADGPWLDVTDHEVHYNVNGKFREAFPAANSFAAVGLGPGRHLIKASLYDGHGDSLNASHSVALTVLSSECYQTNVAFGVPEVAILSPIQNSVFVAGSSGHITVPLKFASAHADLKNGFGMHIWMDGKDMGIMRTDVLLMHEVGTGQHDIHAVLVDAEEDELFCSAHVNFTVLGPGEHLPMLPAFESDLVIKSAELTSEEFQRSQSEDEPTDGTSEQPCFMFVDTQQPRIALFDNGVWSYCDPFRCEDPFVTAVKEGDDVTVISAPPSGICTMYRVVPFDGDWPPKMSTDMSEPGWEQAKATRRSLSNPVIVSAANSLKYMLKYWEPHLNKQLYAQLMGHGYYVYLRGAEAREMLGKRSPMFLKVLAIQEGLELSPTVFFMDSDSWFDRGLLDRIPMQHYLNLNPVLNEEDWIFDEFLAGKTLKLCEINTAAFAIKRSDWTSDILDQWWSLSEDGGFSDWGLGDQILLQYILVRNMTDMLASGDPPSLDECKANLEKCHGDFHDWLDHYFYSGLDMGLGQARRFPRVYFHHHSKYPFFVCHHDFWPECHEQNSFIRHSGRGYFFNYTLFNGKRLLKALAQGSIFSYGIPGLELRRKLRESGVSDV